MMYKKIVGRVCLGILVVLSFLGGANAQDKVADELQKSFIWTNADTAGNEDLHGVFLKHFLLKEIPAKALMNIFTYNRFRLYVNGNYVTRGPNRYENKRPEYVTTNILPYLVSGDNTIAIMAHRYSHSGRIMNHPPGLTALITLTSKTGNLLAIKTDKSWKAEPDLSFLPRPVSWSSISENIDARKMPPGYLSKGFNDSEWHNAKELKADGWWPLHQQDIPPLTETVINDILVNSSPLVKNTSLPVDEKGVYVVKLPRFTQAYMSFDIDAEEGSRIQVTSGAKGVINNNYVCSQGRQIYTTDDTYGLMGFSIKVLYGKIKLNDIKVVERVYPFTRIGSFTSNDTLLNHLWDMMTRSLQVLSEDAYVDCADRERVEWMDDDPPAFDVTRVSMAGPTEAGGKKYADARLLKEMLRRTALTQQADGRVKAHTASDRWDIHAYMEDRACDWVEGARRYYESTGDKDLINEIWKPIFSQMNWFLNHRTARGLVKAREWVVWGNPVGYQNLEGTALNAFVYKALIDAAYLGKAIGQKKQADDFDREAGLLNKAINTLLWDKLNGTYYAGYFANGASDWSVVWKHELDLKITDGNVEPTFEAALFALDQQVVPANRLDSVKRFLMRKKNGDHRIMNYYYLFKQMYAQNTNNLDIEVLNTMRTKWTAMLRSPAQMSFEEFEMGGSRAHIYGIYPAYFLSAEVLGVKIDGPVWRKRIIIQPHLGDLKNAEGTVVTEFGEVCVSWVKTINGLKFTINVPKGITASLKLNGEHAVSKFQLNHKKQKLQKMGDLYGLDLIGGKWLGNITYNE